MPKTPNDQSKCEAAEKMANRDHEQATFELWSYAIKPSRINQFIRNSQD